MKKIIVCLSGGIDSALCAFLLLQKGYTVEGLFMKNWEFKNSCRINTDLDDIKYICEKLQIILHIVNFSSEYWNKVFKTTLHKFIYGYTPNPDIICNKEIKFNLLIKYAFNILKADLFATGHYVQLKNRFLIKSLDLNKDQSYYLYHINKSWQHKIRFPIGNYKKFEIRKIAKFIFFNIYQKKESFGICFVGNKNFSSFLNNFIPLNTGKIQTNNNLIIGQHKGIPFYTLGQKYGLNITKKFNQTSWYVFKKNIHKNLLYVTQHHHNCLYKNSLIATHLTWLIYPFNNINFTLFAKIRYRQIDQPCIVYTFKYYIKVYFLYKQKSITEGQSIVLYKNNICLGGAIIHSTYNRK